MASTGLVDGEFVFTATIKKPDEKGIQREIHLITKNSVSIRTDGDSVTVEPMRKPGKQKIADVISLLESLEISEPQGMSEVKKTERPRYVTSLFDAKQRRLNHGATWIPTQHQIDTGVVPAGFEGEPVCYVYDQNI